MATVTLSDPQARTNFWQRCVLTNLQFWQAYLARHTADTQALEGEWEGVIKAILFGLELEPAWPEAYQLITSFSTFMERRGYWDTWQRVLDQALLAARQASDSQGEVTLLTLSARLEKHQGHFKEMITRYRHAICLARRLGDAFNEGRACTNLGYFYIEHGYWVRAEILCRHALRLFEQIGSNHGLAHTENHLGLLYTRQCRWEEAHCCLERACALWQAMDDRNSLLFGLNNLGLLYQAMEEPDKALEYHYQALHYALQAKDEVEIGRMYLNIADAYRAKEEMAAAERHADRAAQVFQSYGQLLELSQARTILGVACLYQGRQQEGYSHLRAALETVRNLKNRYREIEIILYMADYELKRRDYSQATVLFNEVEQLMEGPDKSGLYCSLQPLLEKCRRILKKKARN